MRAFFSKLNGGTVAVICYLSLPVILWFIERMFRLLVQVIAH